MTSVKKEITITGNGLMKNKPCTVTFKPAKTGQGQIRFFVGNAEPFNLSVDNVLDTKQCVTIGRKNDANASRFAGKTKLILVEHLSAALAFCGIDEVDIYVDGEELPILDGSAAEWVRLLGGMRRTKRYYTVTEPVYYLNGKTSLVILPDKELNITYAVNYDHPDLRGSWVSFNKPDEIIEARTFGFYKDLKKFQALGFAKGVTFDNTVGLTDNGYTTELRSQHEPIKHKILDLIGDLHLAGVNPLNLKAQILVKEAGHAVHVKAAKILKDRLKEIK